MDITFQESNSMCTRFSPRSPLPAKGKYIRVVNILPGKGIDASSIFLELVSEPIYIATGEPSHCYEALSYVWDEEKYKVNINFKQQNDTTNFTFSACAVTQNLSEALLHLRHENVPRSVWIDAICINKGDKTEKNHQVFMMGEIYKKASKVIVCLGPSTSPAASISGSNLAMQVIEKTGQDIQDDWNRLFSVLAGPETYAYAPKSTWYKSVATGDQPMLYNQDESWAILDIFAATHFVEHHNHYDLPSWVPDWASYDKHNDMPATWPRFCEGLTISGISTGTIKNVWPLYQGGAHTVYTGSMIDIRTDDIKAIHIEDQLTPAEEEKLVAAFCRNLYFGEKGSSLSLSNTKIELEQEDCNGFNLRGDLAEEMALRIMHRRFFVTEDGRMGIGSNTIQPGDKVVAFLGSAMPFVITPCHKAVLRVQSDSRHCRLRGGCHVDGAMDLEPFLWALPDGLETFWKDGQVYLEDSKTSGHRIKDPRLERLAGFEGYREWLERGQPKPLISTTPEQWQSIGVDVERFTLL